MRFHNKHDRKNILSNQKIAIIQKANHRSHTRLQFINNELVDRVVRSFDTGNVDEITEKEIPIFSNDEIKRRIIIDYEGEINDWN